MFAMFAWNVVYYHAGSAASQVKADAAAAGSIALKVLPAGSSRTATAATAVSVEELKDQGPFSLHDIDLQVGMLHMLHAHTYSDAFPPCRCWHVPFRASTGHFWFIHILLSPAQLDGCC